MRRPIVTAEPSLFPALEPVPDRFEGLGQDARRTLRQADQIAAGINPGSLFPLHAEAAAGREGLGLRCRDCRHLYRTGAGNSAFLKCDQVGQRHSRGSWGPDMRGWWPACRLFDAAEPRKEVPTSGT